MSSCSFWGVLVEESPFFYNNKLDLTCHFDNDSLGTRVSESALTSSYLV